MLLLSAIALLLFWADAASAQNGWNIHRIASNNERAAKQSTTATGDSLVLDYTEYDPLNRPGIQIIDQDTTTFTGDISGEFFVTEGVHYISGTGKSPITGLWFYAAGAEVRTTLPVGDPNGELSQFIGLGPEYGSWGLLIPNADGTVKNAVFTGHETAIINGIGGHQLDLLDLSIHLEQVYVIRNGIPYPSPNQSGSSIQLLVYPADDNRRINVNITLQNVICRDNASDLFVDITNANLDFFAFHSSFLSFTGEYRMPVAIQYGKSWNSENSSARFLDCQYGLREWEVRTTISEYEWLGGEHKYDGTLMFDETRPGGFVGKPNIIRLWPRETPLIRSDIDGNGEVGLGDVIFVADDFGKFFEEIQYPATDIDQNGVVGFEDVAEAGFAYLGLPKTATLQEIMANPKLPILLDELLSYKNIKDAAMLDPILGPAVEFYLNPTAILDETAAKPNRFVLHQNYPNPFNANTVIPFALAEDGEVALVIRNLTGQVVRTLAQEYLSAGAYTEKWDGKDNFGVSTSTGIYLCELRAGSERMVRKIMLLR